MNNICPTCKNSFFASRKDHKFCSRLCYRRDPNIKTKYSNRTAVYQKIHSTEPSRRYQKLKFKCTHESREISISKEEFISLLSKGCSYCEKDLSLETGCGLDRLNNDEGYTLTNVVPCCGKCNQIKNLHLSHDEMKVGMKAIIEFRKKKMLGDI